MTLKSPIASALVLLITVQSAVAQPRAEPPEVWRQYAERLQSGAFVRVRLKDGTAVKGHVIQVSSDVLRVEPKTRIPVPVRDLRYDDIASMATPKEGKTPGTKVLIGVGVAAVCIFGLFLMALAAIDD